MPLWQGCLFPWRTELFSDMVDIDLCSVGMTIWTSMLLGASGEKLKPECPKKSLSIEEIRSTGEGNAKLQVISVGTRADIDLNLTEDKPVEKGERFLQSIGDGYG